MARSGQRVDRMLTAFDVDVVKVRRSAGEGVLTPDQWRARLGEFDWVILAVPATAETDGMMGAAELAGMKPSAVLVNIARGSVVDQDALVTALTEKRIGGAFLDVTTPEPLPAGHPLWSMPDVHVTMHLSGRAQSQMFQRSGRSGSWRIWRGTSAANRSPRRSISRSATEPSTKRVNSRATLCYPFTSRLCGGAHCACRNIQ